MSALRAAVGAAALVSIALAATCWIFLPHFLDPPVVAAGVLFAGAFVVAGVLLLLLRPFGRRPGAGLAAVLVAAAAAVVTALMVALTPPALAAGNRAGPLVFGIGLVALTGLLARLAGGAAGRAPVALAAVALVVVTLGSFVVRRVANRPLDSVRTLLVGLDGVTWKLAKPLRNAGDMPTFGRLSRDGAVGVLESDDPTLSPRVWTTIATGKLAEQHKIMDFDTPQSALRAARVWEILEGEGRTVGVFGYLVTWPPGSHRGFLVPGWEARGPEAAPAELTFVRWKPRSTREALATAVAFVRHGVRLGSLIAAADAVVRYRGWTDAGYSAATAFVQLALESDVFLDLVRTHRPEFATFVISGSDTVSHLYWRYMDARHFPDVPPAERARYGDVIPDYYRAADRVLARFLDRLPPGAHTIVISDHGNGPLIAARQSLSVKAAELLDELGVPREEVMVTTISGAANFETKSEATRDALRQKLAGIRWVESGTPVFALEMHGAVLTARALKGGIETNLVVDGRTLPIGRILREGKFSGDHTRQGILLAIGPRVRPGARVRGARIRDVTPTLLALFDLPTADDMDGRVIDGLLTESATRERRVATWNHHLPRFEDGAATVGDEVQDRLKALGYL